MASYVQSIDSFSVEQKTGYPTIRWSYTSSEVFDTSLSQTMIWNENGIRYGANRTSFRAKGRFWQFFGDANGIFYMTSEDGIVWKGPFDVGIAPVEPYTDNGGPFSAKYYNGYVYLVVPAHFIFYHFWKGRIDEHGNIFWEVKEQQIPTYYSWDELSGNPDIVVTSAGVPVATLGFYDYISGQISYTKYITYIVVAVQNDIEGQEWDDTQLFNKGLYEDGPGLPPITSIHRIGTNTIIAVYSPTDHRSSGTVLAYYNGTKYGLSDCYYLYRSTNGMQCVSDECKNVYLCWIYSLNGVTPTALKLSNFNITTLSWTTITLLSDMNWNTSTPMAAICRERSTSNIHVYYVIDNKIYRIDVINNPSGGGLGTFSAPQLIYTESQNISELQVSEYTMEEPRGVPRAFLSYVVGGERIKTFIDSLSFDEELAEAVEIYRKSAGEDYFEKKYDIEYPETVKIEQDELSDGEYEYAIRVVGTNGNYSDFTYTTCSMVIQDPQIEFSGRGGFNALRHGIFTFHDYDNAENNVVRIKLWDTENTDAGEEINFLDPGIIMNLKGNKEIETKNVEPFTTDEFVTGSELAIWKEIYSKTSKTDKNTSEKLQLWNGS